MTTNFSQFDDAIATPIGEQEPAIRRHIGIIGASGSGKTTWACQAPDALIILTEPQAAGRIQEANPTARVVPLENLDHLPLCLEWLNTKIFSPESKWKPKTIVLDSVTEMCRLIQDIVDQDKGSEWTFKQWKKYEDGCMRMMRQFRNLPCNIIGLFLDEISRGDDSATGARRLSVGKKSMSPKIAALFDLVFWTEVKDKGENGMVYALRTCGGVYRGYLYEQGKGHPALEKWLDSSEMKPGNIIQTISTYKKETSSE